MLAATAGVIARRSSDDGQARSRQASAHELSVLQRDVARREAKIRSLRQKEVRLRRAADRADARRASSEAGTADTASGKTQTSFSALAKRLGGESAAAYGPTGLGQSATQVGSWSSGPAWSTIKVPISIAVLRRQNGSGSSDLIRRAITASDNEAAKALWANLGNPAAAARSTGAVLADAGDSSTVLQTRVVRSGFTSFGQTIWTLAAQQKFAAALPCLDGSNSVVDLMGSIASDQRWGLGEAGSNQHFKGGWGPDTAGQYLVRQFGLIDVDGGGTAAVALAVKPADGSFATGTRNISELARWVAAHAKGSASPRC